MKIFDKFLTILRPAAERPAAEVARPSGKQKPSPKRDRMPKDKSKIGIGTIKCPYCFSQKFTRRGFRQKKHERVQLYLCQECGRTFTAHLTKGKHYPLPIIFQAISLYNLGYSLEKTCEIVNKRCLENSQFSSTNFQSNTLLADAAHQALQAGNDSMIKRKKSIENSKISRACFLASSKIENSLKTENCKLKIIHPSSLSTWLAEFTDLCRFSRMREFAIKDFSPEEMVITATLAHQQLFRYRFHQAKCKLMIQEEFQHRKFIALKEFLEMVPVECPHQYFMKPASTRGESTRGGGLRASEAPMTFSKKQMIVRAKQNYATRLCEFVLQSVKQRKQRHNALQKFMLYNDSVTVATEVPVYLTKDDLLHLQTQLGFEIYQKKLKT